MLSPDIPLLGFDPYLFKTPMTEFPPVSRERAPIGFLDLAHPEGSSGQVSNGEVTISLSYRNPDDIFIPDQLFAKMGYHRQQFRVLDKLELTARSGASVNMLDLPRGWDAIFSINPLNTPEASAAHMEFQTTVVSNEGILTPAGLLVHAHEVGHAHTTDLKDTGDARSAIKNRSRSLSVLEREKVLAEESNAWAYAFNLLEPVLSGNWSDTFYIEDLSRYALDNCLGSYEKVIEELYLQGGR